MAYMMDETLVTCESEENVIDLEPDASTMTGNPESDTETKTEQNYAIKMSDSKSPDLLNKKSRKSNVLDFFSEQSNGIQPSSFFNSNMMALTTNKLKLTNVFNTVHPELHVSDCEYVRSSLDGRSILGVWHGDQYDAIFYNLAWNFSPRASTVEDDTPSFLKSIEHVGPFFSQSEIKDICDTNCRDQKYVLYIGNCYNKESMQQSSSVLSSFINSSASIGKQYISLKELLCCCGSQNGDVFATGSEEGVFLYHDQEFIHHNQDIGAVNSIEFNSAGSILYCGGDNSKITIFDRRESPGTNSTFQIMDSTSGISEIKLFSNENNLVASGFDGSLSLIDLRKRETVLCYPDHVNINCKIPFSLSEDAGLLCATGTDNLTRLWSLSTGSRLCTIEPHIKTKKVRSCLIVDESRWSVAIFLEHKMYIMEPES